MDEAINANVMIAAHEAARKGMTPRYQSGGLSIIFNYFILVPIWLLLGIYTYTEYGQIEGFGVAVGLITLHLQLEDYLNNNVSWLGIETRSNGCLRKKNETIQSTT